MKNLKQPMIFGLYQAIGLILFTLIMWITKLDSTYLNIGKYFEVGIIALPIAIIFLAIRSEVQAGKVTIWRRFIIAIIVCLVSHIIYEPFLYIYHNHINPGWHNYLVDLRRSDLQAAGTDPEIIEQTIAKMKEFGKVQSQMFRLSATIVFVIIMPLFIALLSMIFIRTKNVLKIS